MGTNEKLVPGELLTKTIMPPELNVWAELNLKNKSKATKYCQTNKINEEKTHV